MDDDYLDLYLDYSEMLQEARAKNAELLKELEWEHALAETLGHCHEDAKAENAKLRELVRDMYECLEHCKRLCKYCKFQGVDCQWFRFNERMRELGVGVD